MKKSEKRLRSLSKLLPSEKSLEEMKATWPLEEIQETKSKPKKPDLSEKVIQT